MVLFSLPTPAKACKISVFHCNLHLFKYRKVKGKFILRKKVIIKEKITCRLRDFFLKYQITQTQQQIVDVLRCNISVQS